MAKTRRHSFPRIGLVILISVLGCSQSGEVMVSDRDEGDPNATDSDLRFNEDERSDGDLGLFADTSSDGPSDPVFEDLQSSDGVEESPFYLDVAEDLHREIADDVPPDVQTDSDDAPLLSCGLLQNGGAETGDLSGWTLEQGDFLAVQRDPGRLPAPYSGDWFFFGGGEARSSMRQEIDVTTWDSAIDRETVWFRMAGQVRDWSGEDRVSFEVQALSAHEDPLASATAGPYSHSYWRERQAAVLLPPGTRRIRVRIVSERLSGVDNDGYVDQLDACLQSEPPPALDAVTLPPYLMAVSLDGVAVLWETESSVIGRVEYSSAESLSHSIAESTTSIFHEIRLTGLSPDTEYRYRICGEDGCWPIHRFRTAPDVSRNLDFVVWGDNQNGPNTFGPLVRRMASLHPDFALSVGDVVQTASIQTYENQLFGPLIPLSGETPFLIAPGNHERYEDEQALLFDHYVSQPGDEHCFGWSYGDLFFMFIDSEMDITAGSDQYACVDSMLQSDAFLAARFQLALFHHPPRVEYWDGSYYSGNEDVRTHLEPLFQAHSVDLVLNGHNHLYAYTPPIDGIGPTWVTTGGGGGEIDGPEDYCTTWDEIAFTAFEHHFLHIRTDSEGITVRAVREDGTEVHRFTLTPG